MSNKGSTPPQGRRSYSPGLGGWSVPHLGVGRFSGPRLNQRKRSTQPQIWAQQTLAIANYFYKLRTAYEHNALVEAVKGGGYTTRDAAIASYFGTFLEFTTVDGVHYVSRREAAMTIQQLLDSISGATGAILVRTPTGWAALFPGDSGQALVINADTGLPDWQAIGGGGGGGGAAYTAALSSPVSSAATTSLQTLFNFSLPANTLKTPGDWLEIAYSIRKANNNNSCSWHVVAGSTSFGGISGLGAAGANDRFWASLRLTLQDDGSAHSSGLKLYGSQSAFTSASINLEGATITEDFTNDLAIAFTAQTATGTAGDFTLESLMFQAWQQ